MEQDNEAREKKRSWLRRYGSVAALAVIGYFVYLLFFSSNSALRKFEYQRVIDSLEREVASTTDSVEYYRRLNERLRSDPRAVEQVVREEHNMNRPGEDVYIMEPE